jgi:hypothetical protein
MTAALKLYETVDALETVRQWMDDNDELIRQSEGVIPDELAALLDLAETQFEDKVERVGLMVREFQACALAVDDEIKRLQQRKKTFDRSADHLKAYLKVNLQRVSAKKVQGKLLTVRIQANPPALRHALTTEQLAAWYAREPETAPVTKSVTYTLDARALLDQYKRGDVLPEGTWVEQGVHVRIV